MFEASTVSRTTSLLLVMLIPTLGFGQAVDSPAPVDDVAAVGKTSSVAAIDAPYYISFQGYLEDDGAPADGTYKFVFRLKDFPTAGLQKWVETQNSVQVTNGMYNVLLGSVSSLASVDFDDDLWLAIEVNDGPELLPRPQIVGTPYSLMSFEALDLRLPASISGVTNVQGNELLKITQTGTGDVLEIDGGGSASGGLYVHNVDLTAVNANSEFGSAFYGSGVTAFVAGPTSGDAFYSSSAGDDGIEIVNPGDNGIIVTNSGDFAFVFQDNPDSNEGSLLTAYVGVVENTGTSTSEDVLALKTGTAGNPGVAANLIGFFDNEDDLIGQIEGNGSGGVAYNTTGADYAEYLPHLEQGSGFEAGDVVGIIDGKVTNRTLDAHQVMVITDRAAVLGNAPLGKDDVTGYEAVSFIGQVPVKVAGPVKEGDYIVASGLDDGTAVAVSSDDIGLDHVSKLIGRSWESSNDPGVKRVNSVVGLDRSEVLESIIRSQNARLDVQEKAIAELRLQVESYLREKQGS